MIIFEDNDIVLEKLNNNCLRRISKRSGIKTKIDCYEFIDKNYNKHILQLNKNVIKDITDRLKNGDSYSQSFVFTELNKDEDQLAKELNASNKTKTEHEFTSTGMKFQYHQDSLDSLKKKTGKSVVSAHVSPTGKCQLRCEWCSVTYRKVHNDIPLETIIDCLEKLQSRGLKAVILSGGGESTAYPQWSELVSWIIDHDLEVAMITNGLFPKNINLDLLQYFKWIRISVNLFKNWFDLIHIPQNKIGSNTVIGASFVYSSTEGLPVLGKDNNPLTQIKKWADKYPELKYIRCTPNCLLPNKELLQQHLALKNAMEKLNDSRFFHQRKVHGKPNYHACYQSYIRPFISEETNIQTGKPGTIYPCDSCVVVDHHMRFHEKYQLCAPEDILDYLDGKIKPNFDPTIDCKGCLFKRNIDLLGDYIEKDTNRFDEVGDFVPEHINFV